MNIPIPVGFRLMLPPACEDRASRGEGMAQSLELIYEQHIPYLTIQTQWHVVGVRSIQWTRETGNGMNPDEDTKI